MRILIATAALQLGSALVTLRNKAEQNSQEDHLLLEQYLGLADTATMLKSSREKPLGTALDSLARCEDAPEGSICFKAVTYLKATGFRLHPDWYPEYSSESLFQDVQAMLNATGKSDCPIPCAISTGQGQEMTTHEEKSEEMEAYVGTMKDQGDGALAKMAQTSKVMNKIESKRAAQDEMAAQIEAEMLQAMANAKTKLEAPTAANVKAAEEREDGVHVKLAQGLKETKKIEGKTVAQDETDADIEAEMLQAMADPKGWPVVSTRRDGVVHAKMAQTFKVVKNIESKPVAQDEAAEIEAEMLQAMADAKRGPRA